MDTNVDIITDIKDCEFLLIHKIVGGKMIIHILPDLAAVECARCEVELAKYHIYVVMAEEQNDLLADLCSKCYVRLLEIPIPVLTIH